jgi:hypothetical protein
MFSSISFSTFIRTILAFSIELSSAWFSAYAGDANISCDCMQMAQHNNKENNFKMIPDSRPMQIYFVFQ